MPERRGWRRSPCGASLGNSAATTPIRASGATAKTRNSRWKLCSWIIRSVAMANSISGATAAIGAWALLLSSTAAADGNLIAGGKFFGEFLHFRCQAAKQPLQAEVAPGMPAFTVRWAGARGARRRAAPARSGSWQRPRAARTCRCLPGMQICGVDRSMPRSSARARRDDVDQIDGVADLRDRRASNDCHSVPRQCPSEVMPSWRALSCSTSTLITRDGSFQSKDDIAEQTGFRQRGSPVR